MGECRSQDQWWFRHFGQEWGPVPFEILVSMAENGTLAAVDDVRSAEGDWQRADKLPGLFPKESHETPAVLERWWYRTRAGTFGPMTTAELAALAERGGFLPTDEIRLGEGSEWLQAGQFEMLFRGQVNVGDERGDVKAVVQRQQHQDEHRRPTEVASAADGATAALQRALGLRPGAVLNTPRRPQPRHSVPPAEDREKKKAAEESTRERPPMPSSRSTVECLDGPSSLSDSETPGLGTTTDEARSVKPEEVAPNAKRFGGLEIALLGGAFLLIVQLYPPLWQRLFAVVDVRTWSLFHYLLANVVFVALLVIYWAIDRNLSQGGPVMGWRNPRRSKIKR